MFARLIVLTLSALLFIGVAGCDTSTDSGTADGATDGAAAAGAGDGDGRADPVAAGGDDAPQASEGECAPSWPAPDSEEIRVEQEEQHLRTLHEQVGRFIDGSVPVYLGTASARDMRGGWDSDHGDGVLESDAVMAWLQPVSWPGPGLELVVVDLATGVFFALRQLDDKDGATDGSLVADCVHASVSYPSGCEDCVAPFDASADAIQIAAQTLPGTWFNGGQQADLDVELDLTRLAPESVEYEHVVAAAGGACFPEGAASRLHLDGDEIRLAVDGWWSTTVPAPGCSIGCHWEDAYTPDGVSTLDGCSQEVGYEAETWISIADPTQRGLRTPTLEEPSVCCSYADPCGGAALFSECWPR